MTDEAHFYLTGFVNKQNFTYWGMEKPKNEMKKNYIHNA